MIQSPVEQGLTLAWTKLRYHAVQFKLWTSTKRFRVVPAGRGSGKTELAKRYLVRHLPVAKPWGDPRYFYAAPTEKQAKRIAWNSLLRLVPKKWVQSINRSELFIETIFGSTLNIVGLDKPQRVEGVQWDGGIMDESSDIKPGTFDLNILPALTHRDGWCWRIGVPKRYGVGAAEYRAFYEEAISGKNPDMEGFTWPSKDILPEKALAFAKAHMDIIDYQEQFDAMFKNAAGGVFHAFDEEYNVRPCKYDPYLPLIVGSDFNVDPMAWVICQRKGVDGGILEVIDELFLRDANTPRTLEELKRRYETHTAGWEFYGDATGRARKTSAAFTDYLLILNHEFFKQRGRTLHYLHSNPPKADRFAATNALICNAEQTRRCFVDPSCKNLVKDLKYRTYKPGTREPEDGGDVGHITDALGYVIYKLFPIRVQLPETGSEVTVT